MANEKKYRIGMALIILLSIFFTSTPTLAWLGDEEITIYKIGCDGKWEAGKPSLTGCLGKRIDIPVTYKALVDKQEVLYWNSDGKSEIRKFHKCNVRDAKNWDCNDFQGIYGQTAVSMRDGNLAADSFGLGTYYASSGELYYVEGIRIVSEWATIGLGFLLICFAYLLIKGIDEKFNIVKRLNRLLGSSQD